MQHQFGGMVLGANNSLNSPHPGANGQRFYTIQRVNGNGGNGKGDGVPGPHKHGLEESDRVKKNSIQRHTAKRDKEEKKTQVSRTSACGTRYPGTGYCVIPVKRQAPIGRLSIVNMG